MHLKSVLPRMLILSAAALSVLSFSACAQGTPVKTRIPEIGKSVASGETVRIAEEFSTQPAPATQTDEQAAGNQADGLVQNGQTACYYQNGTLQKDGIVGSTTDGYYYAEGNGTINFGYSDGVTVDGVNWIVIEGKATQVETDADNALFQAAKYVAKVTDTNMTHEQKLRACFDNIKNDFLEGVLQDPDFFTVEWPITYANDFFTTGRGDCYSYGASFAFMAKAIGYTEVYAMNSGGHGWAEVDGKYYDPEWDKHHLDFDHYAMDPKGQLDIDYAGGVAAGYDWMRVKL